MISESIIFAGAELSSGRKPVTFSGLDEDLNIKVLGKRDVDEVLLYLQDYERCILAINTPSTKAGRDAYAHLKQQVIDVGYRPFLETNHPKRWLETNAQDCFRLLSGHKLLPHRALEGRLQRSAILYEHGLQLTDPVDMFEELTRYKLIQGILPLEKLPSSHELDALVAAFLAWTSFSRSERIVPKGEFVLPAGE